MMWIENHSDLVKIITPIAEQGDTSAMGRLGKA